MEVIPRLIYIIYKVLYSCLENIWPFFELAVTLILFSIMVLFVLLLIIFIIFLIVTSIVNKITYRNLYEQCLSGNYEYVILKGVRLVKWYNFIGKFVFSYRRVCESVKLMLSIAYLAVDDNENFLKCICKVRFPKNAKDFWLCVYSCLLNDLVSAKEYYDSAAKLTPNEEESFSIEFLDGLFCYKNNEMEKARLKMKKVYPKLNHKFTKDLADKIMSGN